MLFWAGNIFFFSFRLWNVSHHYLLGCRVFSWEGMCESDWGSCVRERTFNVCTFSVFSLFSKEESLMCLGEDPFCSALFGVLCPYCICSSLYFSLLWKITFIISLNVSFKATSLSSPLRTAIILRFGILMVSFNFYLVFLVLLNSSSSFLF